MANQDLFYDITKQGTQQEKQQYLITRVGDGGLKTVTIVVWSNGYPYNLTGLTPVFEGVKPDGTKIIDTKGAIVLDAKNGVFRYTFPQQASTAEGEYQQAFFKLKRGEQTDSTLEIRINVLPNYVEFGINSENYFTEYQKELDRLRSTVESGIEELKSKAEATGSKIDSQVETAKALKLQLDLLQEAVKSNKLITRDELDNNIGTLSNQVAAFTDAINGIRQSVAKNVQDIAEAKLDNKPLPGVLSDVSTITKSGFYYFDSTTQNMPYRNSGNSNGYIQALMKDENNGMFSILGTGMSIEKYKGNLFGRWKSALPILLWSGRAGKEAVINCNDSVHNYGQLIINITFSTNRHETKFITVPDNGETLYFNNIGLRSNDGGFKNGYLDEIAVLFKDDKRINVIRALVSTDEGQAVDSDSAITAIWGIY
jgi:regulator of replication initiation timing|nr:MAG TPA: distal tail protein [Caudoviricetes sp.]